MAVQTQNLARTVSTPTEIPDLRRKTRIGEIIIRNLLLFCGVISVLTTVGIVYVLGREALLFFQTEGVSLGKFFGGTTWQPVIDQIGVWPLVTATLMCSFIAMLVAIPVGLSTAIYLSEYASPRARRILKPILEVLAGIPTVVYGYFALTFMTPLLRGVTSLISEIPLIGTVLNGLWGALYDANFEIRTTFNMLSAGIVVGILIVPLVSSLSEDAIHAVPNRLRQASYGLGATRLETSTRVIVPAALSGITAALVIAISRAIGETMIVAIAAGAGPDFTFNPFESAETMTGYMVRISGGDISYQSIDYTSLFAIGLVLFCITLTLNIASQRIVARFREQYD